MIFSKATSYGIRALAYLASRPNGKSSGLREIAEHEKIPPVFLRKVLGELRRHRMIHSAKGIYGGYDLAQPAEAISLWDVVQLLEPDPFWDTCILGHDLCAPDAACPLHNEWQKVRQEMVELLQSKKISQVVVSGVDRSFEAFFKM